MKLDNERELANTQSKLAELERLIQRAQASPSAGREVELRSLNKLANELREEILRYKSTLSERAW
jgi:hypothetical protein